MRVYLDHHQNPRINLEIKLSSWRKVNCLIDTGFSGGVSLPERYQKLFKQKPIAFQQYELADGSIVSYAIYKIRLRFNNTAKETTMFFTKSNEGLVGIEFLLGFKFILDLKKNRVELE